MKVLITGGGSGGHVSPALAVARVLRRRFPDVELLYVGGMLTMEGSSGPSIEEQLVKGTSIPFKAIHAGKLPRQAIGINTIRRLWGVVPGCTEALLVVRKFSPDVIFSTGGYVTVPVVLAAGLLRIPVVVHEQTAAVGLANRLAAKIARKIAITFASSAAFFPKQKTILTGNPLRAEVLHPDLKQLGQTEFGQWLISSSMPLIYVTGGGLGSHILNETLAGVLPALLEQFRVVHQCGAHERYADFDKAKMAQNTWPADLQRNYWVAKSFSAEEVGGLYQYATMVVARAGANTVLELAACGLPTIFVPIPWVTHDEQTRNAQALVEAGTAVIVPEVTLSAGRLAEAIADMYRHLSRYTANKKQAQSLVDEQAADRLADIVVSCLPGK